MHSRTREANRMGLVNFKIKSQNERQHHLFGIKVNFNSWSTDSGRKSNNYRLFDCPHPDYRVRTRVFMQKGNE